MSRTRQNRFRNTGGNRVEDQFGFLMNKNYSNTGGRSGQEKTSKENIDANRAKAMQNLKSFIGNTFGSAIDTVTLGATDFDKKPAVKASKTSRLLLVFVPHVLALAPVAMSSSLSLSEYVLAMFKPL